MKKFYSIAAIALAVLTTFTSCGSKEKTEDATVSEARIEKVKTQQMTNTTITREVVLSAVLQGYETQNVAPSVTGKIEHIYVEEGAKVATGDNLVRMDE